MPREHLIIVDPFSSGGVLARRAREVYGLESVAVISQEGFPASLTATYHRDDFVAEVKHESLGRTIEAVERIGDGAPRLIMCGSEPGVEIFDQLANHWDLLPNDLATSTARRDKFLMQARLKDQGVRFIAHHKGSDLDEIESWCSASGADAFVVKPLRSFATDGVHFCSTLGEVREAGAKLLGTRDYSGTPIDEVLVEELVRGPEFVVDSVSSGGNHFVVDMFRYTKESITGAPLYRTMAAVPVSDYPEVAGYVHSALTALGVRNGPAHSEVILTEGGPVLVESGARMHGGQGPRLVERAFSHSLVDLSLASRIDPAAFRESTRTPSALTRGIVECFLSAGQDGTVTENRVTSFCSQLDSYLYDTCAQAEGDAVQRTVDLLTSYGRVVLSHADSEHLARDLDAVMTADRDGSLLAISPGTRPA